MIPDWSDLPDELLKLIADRLYSRLELTRFRTVCRSWRSSSNFTPFRNFSLQISPLFAYNHSSPFFHFRSRNQRGGKHSQNQKGEKDSSSLTLTSYFHIKQPSSSSKGWLIKLESLESGNIRCLSPLSRRPIHHCSETLDLFELPVSRVYETRAIIPQKKEKIASQFKRVVLFPDSMEPRILSIGLDEKLRYWDHETKTWIKLDDQNRNFHDMIITHESQLYVVDEDGTVYWVDKSLHLIQFASPVGSRTWQKHLVESRGEIYVVDRFLAGTTRTGQVVDDHFLTRCGVDRHHYRRIAIRDNNGLRLCSVLTHSDPKTVAFYVYKLDEEWAKWEKVRSLNGQAFVIATDCCFSISACEFDGCLENSIYFTDEQDGANPGIGFNGHDLSVFSLDDGSIKKISSSSSPYFDLFCPSFLQM